MNVRKPIDALDSIAESWPEAGGGEIEVYRYTEAPWTEDGTGLSFVDVFPFSADPRNVDHSSAVGDSGGGVSSRQMPPAADLRSVPEEEWVQQLAAARCEAEERGRRYGLEAGLGQGRNEAAQELALERGRLQAQASSLLHSFAAERDRALHWLEEEAVRLALAIAARILRREAQMDPLLLTGAVRVALGQLAQSTVVQLRVPGQDQPMWEEALARMPGLPLRPRLIGDAGMELGECRMETELGSADLGLWAQLKEIERGFFDRVGGCVPGAELGTQFGAFSAEAGSPHEAGAHEADRPAC